MVITNEQAVYIKYSLVIYKKCIRGAFKSGTLDSETRSCGFDIRFDVKVACLDDNITNWIKVECNSVTCIKSVFGVYCKSVCVEDRISI